MILSAQKRVVGSRLVGWLVFSLLVDLLIVCISFEILFVENLFFSLRLLWLYMIISFSLRFNLTGFALYKYCLLINLIYRYLMWRIFMYDFVILVVVVTAVFLFWLLILMLFLFCFQIRGRRLSFFLFSFVLSFFVSTRIFFVVVN